MKKISTITAIIVSLLTAAQPVLNASDVSNSVNRTEIRLTSNSTTLGVGNAGANQNWDFSTLTFVQQGPANTYSSATTAPFSSSFPTANFYVKNMSGTNTAYDYVRLTNNIYEIVGYSTASVVNNSFSNPFTIFTFPFSYNDQFTDTHQQGSQPVATFTRLYDAYGTLIIASGTYSNVFRFKDIFNNGSPSYIWFKLNPFRVIFVASTNINGTTSYTTYQDPNLSTTQNEVKQFAVYPNPTSGNINIKNIDFSNKSMFVKVYNMLGNQIINNYKLETESANIDLSNCSSGLYFIEIADENNKVLYQDKIIKK